jgi:hypothetical protein|tara:strand:+ start:950 stop:1114 length:165 start_codon:yes stop_codon:yes gene_type:complete
MKPLYLKPQHIKTPKDQWDELTEEQKWDKYLTALVTVDEMDRENEAKVSRHINN